MCVGYDREMFLIMTFERIWGSHGKLFSFLRIYLPISLATLAILRNLFENVLGNELFFFVVGVHVLLLVLFFSIGVIDLVLRRSKKLAE